MTDAATVRDEVRTWLEENWDPERSLLEWRWLLADSGWGCPAWPRESFGRGINAALLPVVSEEFDRAGAVGAAMGTGMGLVAPTLLAHASEEVKSRLLRPIITGEHKWCQLFSEPGNGSDLAGLTTRAVRDGDEWVVNGQKVWNTGALQASYGMLLARTDFDVPKHKGITFFALEMHQAGVEVRPLKQMNFHASFNEVFMTDARVAHTNMVGAAGEGWRVALTTLTHERGLATNRRPKIPKGPQGRTVREAAEESAAYFKTYEWYPQRAGRTDLVGTRAEAHGVSGDALVRQEAIGLHELDQTARWTSQRAQAARAAGLPPGPEGSLGKLSSSNIARAAAHVHGRIAGAHGMLSATEAPESGIVAEVLISVPGQSIAGGTDEIQHNILGERVLGLPKEPTVDADIPFREVRTNPSR